MKIDASCILHVTRKEPPHHHNVIPYDPSLTAHQPYSHTLAYLQICESNPKTPYSKTPYSRFANKHRILPYEINKVLFYLEKGEPLRGLKRCTKPASRVSPIHVHTTKGTCREARRPSNKPRSHAHTRFDKQWECERHPSRYHYLFHLLITFEHAMQ